MDNEAKWRLFIGLPMMVILLIGLVITINWVNERKAYIQECREELCKAAANISKMTATREEMIEKLINSTSNSYGGLRGGTK